MRFIHLLTLGLLALSAPAAGSTGAGEDSITMNEIAGGALLVPAGEAPGRYVPLPGLRTDVDLSITGIAAHVEVSQVFHNPSTGWLEAVYVFPLPDDSALTTLRMVVGDRVLEGVVREKKAARKEYAAARREGRKAGIVEQQRPNLFTSSVANIPPGGSVTITLSYLETVDRDGDRYSLRVPLVAGPRYMPPGPPAGHRDRNDRAPGHAPVLVNPNTVPPAFGKVNPVTVRFELDAGFALESVTSPYHNTTVSMQGDSRARGELAGTHFADRDFELRWRAVAGRAPQATAFVDDQGGHSFVLLMVQPPLPGAAAPAPPRELVLIIDASGSMHGDSIEQALSAARFALSTLRDNDRFNIIRFSDSPSMLFPSAQPAGPAALAEGELFLSRIEAEGGTNVAAALHRAFSAPAGPGLLQQIVFLTDGAVGNESELFSMIADGTSESRLFTVGIGSAPNGYFMRRAARTGRGTYTFIGRGDEVQSRMAALFDRIRNPVLTDIRVDWHGAAQAGTGRVPDVYSGEPLTLTAKVSGFRGVTLSGRYAGEVWTHAIGDAGSAGRAPWVSTLWARERIERLEDDLLGGGDRERVKQGMIEIGLAHQLVTPYTSLVAVERWISRDPSEPLHHADAPVNLPHGWSYRHVFGSMPRTALGWRAELAAGLLLLILGLVSWRFARSERSSPA